MSNITTGATLFTPEQVGEIFNKVKGHSAIANLAGQSPIPFSGVDSFVFTMDGEAALVGEGQKKPAGNAEIKTVSIKPVKVVYQHRVTDEFMHMAEEKALPYLQAFMDGFSKKIASAVDIIGFHKMNPATQKESDLITSAFDKDVTATVTYDAANADDNIQEAVSMIIDKGGTATGIAMAPAFATALGSIKEKTGSKVPLYNEFRFGNNPGSFGGMTCDVNRTVSFGGSNDMAIVGDFANAIKWGYTDTVKTEVIPYGNPDGLGDLKEQNQVVLRAEAYIGFGIIDPDSFARIVSATAAAADKK